MAEKKIRTVFILAYYSALDPVFRGAVLPYFRNFPDRRVQFVLLTYEHNLFPMSHVVQQKLESEFERENIKWFRLTWNSGSFKALKKIYDFVKSIFYARTLIRQHDCDSIYSEGFPGAIIGHYLSLITGRRHMIHTFEPHADYMFEAGVWGKFSWEYQLLKLLELRVAKKASHIFTATKEMIHKLEEEGISSEKLFRVPSCIDLERFKFSNESRKRIRQELGLVDTDVLVTYLGKVGGMYMEEEIFDFYKVLASSKSVNYKFLFITTQASGIFLNWIGRKDMNRGHFTIMKATHEEVPDYLSASDVGFVAVRQRKSKRFCSPIKTGEYLACGLPIIIPTGISDDFDILGELNLALLMNNTSDDEYQRLAGSLDNFDFKRPGLREACRQYCKNDRDIKKYKNIYAKVF